MNEDNVKPESLPNIKECIAKVQEQHLNDLERLYALHAEEYFDDAIEKYISVDDTLLDPSDDLKDAATEAYKKVEVCHSFIYPCASQMKQD